MLTTSPIFIWFATIKCNTDLEMTNGSKPKFLVRQSAILSCQSGEAHDDEICYSSEYRTENIFFLPYYVRLFLQYWTPKGFIPFVFLDREPWHRTWNLVLFYEITLLSFIFCSTETYIFSMLVGLMTLSFCVGLLKKNLGHAAFPLITILWLITVAN